MPSPDASTDDFTLQGSWKPADYIEQRAKQTGVSRKVTHDDEALGLVPRPQRKGRYRINRKTDVDLIALIKCTQSLGFSLEETMGASRAQKAQLVKEVTDSLVHVLNKKPEHTHIAIQEIAEENWGFSGLLTDDWKKL